MEEILDKISMFIMSLITTVFFLAVAFGFVAILMAFAQVVTEKLCFEGEGERRYKPYFACQQMIDDEWVDVPFGGGDWQYKDQE